VVLLASLAAVAGAIGASIGALTPAIAASGSGGTKTGVVGGTFTSQSGDPSATNNGVPAPAKGDQFGMTISVNAPEGIPEANTGVLGGDNEKAQCDGSFAKPSAPPGFLCVYLNLDSTSYTSNVFEGKNASGVVVTGEGSALAQTVPIGSGRRGVEFTWFAAAKGPSTLLATWAYTPHS